MSSLPSSSLSIDLLHFWIVSGCAWFHMQTTKGSLNKACVSYCHLVVISFPLMNPKISWTPSSTHLSIHFIFQLQWVQCIIQNENSISVSWIIRSNNTRRNLFFKTDHSVFSLMCVLSLSVIFEIASKYHWLKEHEFVHSGRLWRTEEQCPSIHGIMKGWIWVDDWTKTLTKFSWTFL